MNSATIVQKLWNYCNVLRDDGMSYGDYVEQLTYLLFLKMTDERSRPPYKQASLIQTLQLAAFAAVRRLTEIRGDLTSNDLRGGFECASSESWQH